MDQFDNSVCGNRQTIENILFDHLQKDSVSHDLVVISPAANEPGIADYIVYRSKVPWTTAQWRNWLPHP